MGKIKQYYSDFIVGFTEDEINSLEEEYFYDDLKKEKLETLNVFNEKAFDSIFEFENESLFYKNLNIC